MKKRLLSLLVALCMAVTLLPVSALTAWAEESGSTLKPLQIWSGYPVLDGITPTTDPDGHNIYTGDGWSYDGTTKTLKLNPTSPTEYDFSSLSSGGNTLDCALEIGAKATITSGSFTNDITNHGIVSGGTFSPIEFVKPCLTFANYGIITDGTFYAPFNTPSTSFELSNYPSGTIEGGNFRNSSSNFSFSNQGSINGGIFSTAPDNSIKLGYILKCSGHLNDIFYATCYVIPNTNSTYPTKITASFGFGALSPFDVTIDNTQQMLLTEWAGNIENFNDAGEFHVTFTAPPAKANTVTLSKLTRLVIDENGYPVGTEGGTQDYSGNGWKFENGTLTLESGNYNFSGEKNALGPLNPDVNLVVESGATLAGGAFKNMPTVKGAGTDPFKKVTLNGTGSITAVNGLASGDWGNTLYVVKTGDNTITASEPILDINRILLESVYPNSSNKNTVCINIKSLNSVSALDPEADIILNQASHGLPLIMASNGTPVIDNTPYKFDGGHYTYYGDGWHIQKSFEGIGTLYLTGGNTYNFRFTDPVNKTGQLDAVNCGIVNEYGIIEDGIFNTLVANGWPDGDPTKTHEIEGGTFAAGLLYNDGVITGGAFNGKDSLLNKLLGSTVVSDTALSGDYRSVTVKDGAISKVNDTPPLVYNETTHDLVQGSAWDLYSYAGTVLTVESNVDITNINGQKISEAFGSYYLNGETNKKVVCFEMPDSDVELNSTKIVVPDPKPEPKPEPEPEAPTYTLTVKGGTFTYNGGEAMTSANVPVDAEVKVTLNQSAVPEGMVFDLWAMDEASLLGNPAVAYNEESFTIPAGSVAKGSTVTVEAQYRDATIESEPSILGTAAIIGVAGAGTAVIVWQGYRIGMELYEKYFQPTPEETAAEQPAPEAPAAAAAS